ncbi:MAG: rRNA maturation RNase YbeY [Deltaproteobacteria bacterium]|nr:rRNA maturation RNase YbeY [Deltaproteobacteria bacterium]
MKKVLKDLACHDGELSILFTGDKNIAELNRDYAGVKGPTNVLAFPMSGGPPPNVESGMLGDVVVSVDTAIRESEKLGEPLEETVYRLLIHGLLHLLNYDHERSTEEADRMEKEQIRLLALIKGERS